MPSYIFLFIFYDLLIIIILFRQQTSSIIYFTENFHTALNNYSSGGSSLRANGASPQHFFHEIANN